MQARPQRPDLEFCEEFICEWLLAQGERYVVERRGDALSLRWQLLSDELDRKWAKPAWEVMREYELIPDLWCEPSWQYRQIIRCVECEGSGSMWSEEGEYSVCGRCEKRGTWSGPARARPSTLRSVLSLASDREGVARAVELAREFVARIHTWIQRPSGYYGRQLLPDPDFDPQRVLWRTATPRDRHGPDLYHPGKLYMTWFLIEALAMAKGSPELTPYHCPVTFDAPLHERAAEHWREAVAQDLRVPAIGARSPFPNRPPNPTIGRRFAEFPDPFEPLMQLYASGYLIEDLTPEGLALIAHELGDTSGR